MSEPKSGGCTRLAEILGELSHDSVNRFLLRERYEPKDLFNEIKPYINIVGGVLSVDDTVADKPYSNPDKAELIGYFWSGKHHQDFSKFHDDHWGIENYHRATKQVCSLERFMVRDSEAIKTHIFCSIRAFVQLELMRIENLINNWYEVQRNLFKKAIREYILENRASVARANADDCLSVNA